MTSARVLLLRVQIPVTIVLIAIAACALPPDLDETYYWTWAQAPAFAYYDHPPGIAWALAITTGILGDGILGLRAVSLLSMAIVALCTIASVQRLVPAETRHAARQLAILSLLGAPMFTLGYLPATPDPLQGAAVAIAAYAIVRGWSFLAAFTLVASLLVKHSTAALALGALPFLLTRRAWLGIAAGALLLVPWLLLDPSTGFQLDRVLSSNHRGPIAVPMTIGSMMGTLGPLTALLLLALPFLRLEPIERPLAFGSLLLILACVVAVWFGTGEANWPMPAMVFALPGLVGFVVRRGGRLLTVASAIARVSALLMVVALLHVVHPFLPFPPVKDRTMRSAGFDEVADAARATAAEIGATKVIARRYQIASELRYHLQDELTVHELGTSRRSQYDLWPRPPLCSGEPAVLVLPHDGIPAELPAASIGPAIPVLRSRAGRSLDHYYVTPIRMREGVGCR